MTVHKAIDILQLSFNEIKRRLNFPDLNLFYELSEREIETITEFKDEKISKEVEKKLKRQIKKNLRKERAKLIDNKPTPWNKNQYKYTFIKLITNSIESKK